MPLSFPQEFLNWICTCNKTLRKCSIRFLDDWWTWFIGSQLLYSLRANWITLWGNWLLCYGMHHSKLSKLPGAWLPPPNRVRQRSDIALLWWKVWWLSSWQEITFFPCYTSLFWDWKHHNQGYINVILYDGTGNQEGEISNIMINNSFHKWNYGSMCRFLVNWILEENDSHNCYISGSRVIMIGFRVIMIFIVFISPC